MYLEVADYPALSDIENYACIQTHLQRQTLRTESGNSIAQLSDSALQLSS